MKILFFSIVSFNARVYLDHFFYFFSYYLQKNDIDIKFIMSEELYHENQENHILDILNPIVISNLELNYIFINEKLSKNNMRENLYYSGLNAVPKNRFEKICKSKLKNWIPDLIVGQSIEFGYMLFDKIFPNALCITNENAVFSRYPFKRTLAFDPYSPIVDSFFSQFSEQIQRHRISIYDNIIINKFKKKLQKCISEKSDTSAQIIEYKKKYKKTILLPLVGTKWNAMFKLSYFESDFKILEYVLNNTPQNIGVFVTEHDSGGILNKSCLAYFRKKYKNFLYIEPKTKGYTANSLYYFEHVDAVLNTTSKTAFMAMLWDKPIISLANKYNDILKDADDFSNIDYILSNEVRNKNNIIHWYFTCYMMYLPDFEKDNFLFNYLEEKISFFRKNGITFEFFNEVNNLSHICDRIIQDICPKSEFHNAIKIFYKRLKKLLKLLLN